jgi:hypothetical protein
MSESVSGERLLTNALLGHMTAMQALQKLGPPLSRLVGVEGYHALLKRSLHLAISQHAVLRDAPAGGARRGILPATGPASTLEALSVALRAVEPAQANAALAAVLTHLLALLATFIGTDLTLRALREIWPGAPETFPTPNDSHQLGGRTHAASQEASP